MVDPAPFEEALLCLEDGIQTARALVLESLADPSSPSIAERAEAHVETLRQLIEPWGRFEFAPLWFKVDGGRPTVDGTRFPNYAAAVYRRAGELVQSVDDAREDYARLPNPTLIVWMRDLPKERTARERIETGLREWIRRPQVSKEIQAIGRRITRAERRKTKPQASRPAPPPPPRPEPQGELTPALFAQSETLALQLLNVVVLAEHHGKSRLFHARKEVEHSGCPLAAAMWAKEDSADRGVQEPILHNLRECASQLRAVGTGVFSQLSIRGNGCEIDGLPHPSHTAALLSMADELISYADRRFDFLSLRGPQWENWTADDPIPKYPVRCGFYWIALLNSNGQHTNPEPDLKDWPSLRVEDGIRREHSRAIEWAKEKEAARLQNQAKAEPPPALDEVYGWTWNLCMIHARELLAWVRGARVLKIVNAGPLGPFPIPGPGAESEVYNILAKQDAGKPDQKAIKEVAHLADRFGLSVRVNGETVGSGLRAALRWNSLFHLGPFHAHFTRIKEARASGNEAWALADPFLVQGADQARREILSMLPTLADLGDLADALLKEEARIRAQDNRPAWHDLRSAAVVPADDLNEAPEEEPEAKPADEEAKSDQLMAKLRVSKSTLRRYQKLARAEKQNPRSLNVLRHIQGLKKKSRTAGLKRGTSSKKPV